MSASPSATLFIQATFALTIYVDFNTDHPEALACTLLTDDHTEVDGSPVRAQRLAVSTQSVAFVRPDLLSYFVVI